jgi:hypothetical protein
MGKVNKRSPAYKVSRAPECRVLRAVELVQGMDFGGSYVVLRVRVGKDEAVYAVEPTRSDVGGQSARFVKQGEVLALEDGSGWHDCLLDGENSTCCCKGFQRWGGTCRHLFALEVALRRGWLR